jgi:hypothetical protein
VEYLTARASDDSSSGVRIAKLKVFAGLMLGLACAGCASDICLSLISRKVHETPRAEVVDRISRTTNDGGLLASSFYYCRQPPPVSQALLGRFDARARREGCLSGAVPRRRHVVTERGNGALACAHIMVFYACD